MRLRKPRALSFASVAAEREALSAKTSVDVLPLVKSASSAWLSYRRTGHLVAPDQLVLGVRIHVVLVAKKALAVLLRPTGVAILLPQLRGFLLPVRRRLTSLHGFVLVTAVALLRHRHDRGINHLTATRHVALRRKMLVKA